MEPSVSQEVSSGPCTEGPGISGTIISPLYSGQSVHPARHDHVQNHQVSRITGQKTHRILATARRRYAIAQFAQHFHGNVMLLGDVIHHQDVFGAQVVFQDHPVAFVPGHLTRDGQVDVDPGSFTFTALTYVSE